MLLHNLFVWLISYFNCSIIKSNSLTICYETSWIFVFTWLDYFTESCCCCCCFSCWQIEDGQCGRCGNAVHACQLASRLLRPGRDCDRLQDLLLSRQVTGSARGLSGSPDLDPWGTGRCWTRLDQWSGSVDCVQGDYPFLSRYTVIVIVIAFLIL